MSGSFANVRWAAIIRHIALRVTLSAYFAKRGTKPRRSKCPDIPRLHEVRSITEPKELLVSAICPVASAEVDGTALSMTRAVLFSRVTGAAAVSFNGRVLSARNAISSSLDGLQQGKFHSSSPIFYGAAITCRTELWAALQEAHALMDARECAWYPCRSSYSSN